MEKITLFSTDCPKCFVLETKLKEQNLDYTKNTDIDDMIKRRIYQAPMLLIDDKYYDYRDALKWLRERGKFNE